MKILGTVNSEETNSRSGMRVLGKGTFKVLPPDMSLDVVDGPKEVGIGKAAQLGAADFTANIGKGVASAAQFAGDVTGLKSLQRGGAKLHKTLSDAESAMQEQYPTGDITDTPSLMKSGSWWVRALTPQIGYAALSFGGGRALATKPFMQAAIGAGIAGATEGGASYGELRREGKSIGESSARAGAEIVGVAALNAIPLTEIFAGKPAIGILRKTGKAALVGGMEMATEWAEEPWQAGSKVFGNDDYTEQEKWDYVIQSAIQGVNVMPVAFFTGGGMQTIQNTLSPDYVDARTTNMKMRNDASVASSEIDKNGNVNVTYKNGEKQQIKFIDQSGVEEWARENPTQYILSVSVGGLKAEIEQMKEDGKTVGEATEELLKRRIMPTGFIEIQKTLSKEDPQAVISLVKNRATTGTLDHELWHDLFTAATERAIIEPGVDDQLMKVVGALRGDPETDEKIAYELEREGNRGKAKKWLLDFLTKFQQDKTMPLSMRRDAQVAREQLNKLRDAGRKWAPPKTLLPVLREAQLETPIAEAIQEPAIAQQEQIESPIEPVQSILEQARVQQDVSEPTLAPELPSKSEIEAPVELPGAPIEEQAVVEEKPKQKSLKAKDVDGKEQAIELDQEFFDTIGEGQKLEKKFVPADLKVMTKPFAPSYIKKMKYKDAKMTAQSTRYEDGQTVWAEAAGNRTVLGLRNALLRHRKSYMDLTGKKERAPMSEETRQKHKKAARERVIKQEWNKWDEIKQITDDLISSGIEEGTLPVVGQDVFIEDDDIVWSVVDYIPRYSKMTEATVSGIDIVIDNGNEQKVIDPDNSTLAQDEDSALSELDDIWSNENEEENIKDAESKKKIEKSDIGMQDSGDDSSAGKQEDKKSLRKWKADRGIKEDPEQGELFGKGAVGDKFVLKQVERKDSSNEYAKREIEKNKDKIQDKRHGSLFDEKKSLAKKPATDQTTVKQPTIKKAAKKKTITKKATAVESKQAEKAVDPSKKKKTLQKEKPLLKKQTSESTEAKFIKAAVEKFKAETTLKGPEKMRAIADAINAAKDEFQKKNESGVKFSVQKKKIYGLGPNNLKMVDPETLIPTEMEKPNKANIKEMAKWYKDWLNDDAFEDPTPIAVVKTESGLEVIDGHHRRLGAIEANSPVEVVAISEESYNKLKKTEDGTTIAAAMYLSSGLTDPAERIESQFPGSETLKTAFDIVDDIELSTLDSTDDARFSVQKIDDELKSHNYASMFDDIPLKKEQKSKKKKTLKKVGNAGGVGTFKSPRLKGLKKSLRVALVDVPTVLENISKKLAREIRDMENRHRIRKLNIRGYVDKFLKTRVFDKHPELFNGDYSGLENVDKAVADDIKKAMDELADMLEKYQLLSPESRKAMTDPESGIFYFPRAHLNHDALMAHLDQIYADMGFNESERNEYSQRVLAYIAKAGKEPSQLTKEDFVRAIMHTYKGKASRRGNLKRRTIQQLKDKELQFYMKPRAILDKYITNMLEEIQKRDFFITNSKQYRDDMNALQRYETIYDTRDFLDAYYDEAPEKGDPRYKEYQADLARIRRAEKWFAGYNEKKGKAGKELEKLPVPSTDQEMLSVTIDHFKERTNDASGVERIVTELVEAGEITPEQMQTVQEVLQARFAKGSTKNWVRLSKMLMYGLVLGQVPRAALRQLGDFANISMKYGVLPSLKAVGQTVPESLPWIRKQLKTHHHTMQSFGLQDSHAEHIGGGLSADFAKSAFKWSGLTWMDTLMKSSYIRASENEVLSLYKTWKDGGAGSIKAKNKLFKKMEDIFVDETSQVIAEIGENPSGDQMQRYLFHSLMNQFPVTTSNQPQGKMEASSIGQFLYMFKSYNIKLLDALYRNGINQMVHAAKSTEMENTKRVAIFSKGFGQVSKAIGQVVTMNLLATELINLLYNRGGDDDDPYWKELLDNAQNELLQLIFFNRYMSYQFSKGDITQMIGGAITPPATILEKGVQDINAIMKGKLDDGLRTAQYIPFFGGLWYAWFGRGAKQKEKRENRNNKKKSLKRYR